MAAARSSTDRAVAGASRPSPRTVEPGSRAGHVAASHALAAADPVMAGLVADHGPMRIDPKPPASRRFEVIARSIAYQQLHGRAAATIWERVRNLVDGTVEPHKVLALDPVALRGAGLSGSKVASVLDLARQVEAGSLRLDRIGRLDDDAVVEELTKVRGIGPWTAQMFLIFHLHRLDVWPTGDFGVRNGYHLAYRMAAMPSPKELEALGERFRPYRSVAAWYCWRAVDTFTPG
jgi:3-methyladenine DNA glycosylase/8-oxoguanine DNA glycosylase